MNLSGNYVQFNESNPSNIQGSVTIVAQDNCTTSIPFAISVSLPPVLGITHVGSCSNAPVTFSAMDSLGSPLIDYSWDFFGGRALEMIRWLHQVLFTNFPGLPMHNSSLKIKADVPTPCSTVSPLAQHQAQLLPIRIIANKAIYFYPIIAHPTTLRPWWLTIGILETQIFHH